MEFEAALNDPEGINEVIIEKLIKGIQDSRGKFSNLEVCKRFILYRLLGPFRPLSYMFNFCCDKKKIKKFNERIVHDMKVFE
jgi:hypothetical protein